MAYLRIIPLINPSISPPIFEVLQQRMLFIVPRILARELIYVFICTHDTVFIMFIHFPILGIRNAK